MKKLYISAFLAVAALAFTSCEADKEPVYHAPDPATFVLNTPPMANQLYVLEEGGTIDLTTSQPDYGVATVTNYSVDVTLDDQFIEASEGKEANYRTLTPKEPTQAKISLDDATLAEYLCQLQGINSFMEYPEGGLAPVKVTMRAHAWISGVESSQCVSNDIVLNAVQLYNPFPRVPGHIYIVGTLTGDFDNPKSDGSINDQWVEPAAANSEFYSKWSIEETGVGTKKYIGSVYVHEGEQYFRFYSKLDGWDADGTSIGSSTNGEHNQPVTFSSTATSLNAVLGKGNWITDASWKGGDVTFEIDLTDPSNPVVTAKTGKYAAESYVYLVGDFGSGWTEPKKDNADHFKDWRLVCSDGSGIYTNTLDINAANLYFRIYPELSGWGNTPYSSDNGGQNLDVTLGSAMKCATGEGCWHLDWAGGKITFTLDTTADPATLTVTAAD